MPTRFRPAAALALGLALAAAWNPVARADLVVQAPNVVTTPGSTGTFDVIITNTNAAGGASYDVAFAALDLMLVAAPSGVQFTDATTATSPNPYIFVTSADDFFGDPLSITPFPNQEFTTVDTEFAAPGVRTIGPGETFGLAHVSYSVAAGTAPGTWTLAIAGGTSLLDGAGAPVAFTTTDGSFTVNSVPEPSSMALIGVGLLALARPWRRLRSRSGSV